MISLSQIPWNSIKTAGRYTLTIGGTVIATAGVVGLLSQGDAATATQALKDFVGAVGTMITSLATLAGIVVSAYATIKGAIAAAPSSQRQTLAATGDVIITDPASAKAVPSKNVVSSLQEAAKLPQVEPTIASAEAAQAVRTAVGG